MILIMEPFGKTNDIWYSGGLIFNGRFFIMVGDEIYVVADSGSGSPEEEPVNPPAHGVSVLLCFKYFGYFHRRSLTRVRFISCFRIFVVSIMGRVRLFTRVWVVVVGFAFGTRRRTVCCRRPGTRPWA